MIYDVILRHFVSEDILKMTSTAGVLHDIATLLQRQLHLAGPSPCVEETGLADYKEGVPIDGRSCPSRKKT